jgi:cytochrome P450
MVDLLEPHESPFTEVPPGLPSLEITGSTVQALRGAAESERQRDSSAHGTLDDSEWIEAFPAEPRLKIEKVLSGPRAFVAKILVYCWRPFFFLVRPFRVFRLPFTKIYFVTRFDDVQEVLGRDDAFRTPFRAKAARLKWQPPFLLDQQYGRDYRAVKQDVLRHFAAVDLRGIVKPSDLKLVEERSRVRATKILDSKLGTERSARMEVIRELVCRVPTLVCQDYFGITPLARLDEERLREIEDGFIAVSAFMFGDALEPALEDPVDDKTRHARHGAVRIREIIREAIVEAWADRIAGKQRDDVLFRMVLDDRPDPRVPGTEKRRWFDDARMTSYLFAMMLGFIPTNLMANGNMLEILFDRDEALEEAKDAARAGDDDLLRRHLFEAMRFRPLNPGPWRRANVEFLLGADARRPRRLREDWTVWPCTQSAMFDSRRVKKPGRFDANRSPYVYMVYGFGLHRCIGKPIADVQITQTMKALLLRKNLRVSGGLKRMSMFPRSMTLTYDAGVEA